MPTIPTKWGRKAFVLPDSITGYTTIENCIQVRTKDVLCTSHTHSNSATHGVVLKLIEGDTMFTWITTTQALPFISLCNSLGWSVWYCSCQQVRDAQGSHSSQAEEGGDNQ